ncbi:MAG: lycopene cyclase domain-containing protein [Candidatus Micrarchaeota archaeon]|nr:lycopene cyclase domain-containing protein [Candidatus Micrarchaeota archaeon]
MAWWYYSAYLLAVLLSSIFIARVASVKIDARRFFLSLLPVFAVFVLWDVAAVELGHWRFGLEHMAGAVIYNQPLEELAFFVVIPLFYVVVWETAKKVVACNTR